MLSHIPALSLNTACSLNSDLQLSLSLFSFHLPPTTICWSPTLYFFFFPPLFAGGSLNVITPPPPLLLPLLLPFLPLQLLVPDPPIPSSACSFRTHSAHFWHQSKLQPEQFLFPLHSLTILSWNNLSLQQKKKKKMNSLWRHFMSSSNTLALKQDIEWTYSEDVSRRRCCYRGWKTEMENESSRSWGRPRHKKDTNPPALSCSESCWDTWPKDSAITSSKSLFFPFHLCLILLHSEINEWKSSVCYLCHLRQQIEPLCHLMQHKDKVIYKQSE